MRGSAAHDTAAHLAEGLAWHVARLGAAVALYVWRGCRIARWQLARQRTRRALARLDDRLLHDIGISREEAMREAEKPFWIS